MVDEDKEISAGQQEINAKSMAAAFKAACMPLYVTRFETLPAPMPGHLIVTFGGGLTGKLESEDGEVSEYSEAVVHAAYMMNAQFAANLCERLSAMIRKLEEGQTEAPAGAEAESE